MTTNAAIPVMIMGNSLHHGGAERFTSRLICGLQREKVRPRLVVLREEVSYDLPEDVPLDVLGYQSGKDLPKAVMGLRRLMKRHRPAVILGTGSAVNTVIGLALKTMTHRPAWIARIDITLFRRDLRLRRMVLGRLLPSADAIVANSKGLRDELARTYPKNRHKITCIYNPVGFEQLDRHAREPARWSSCQKIPLLATVGRAHSSKGWEFLIEVFGYLHASIPCELVMCGDGPLLEKLRAKAQKMTSGRRIHLLGRCDNPFAILSQADLFLLASEAEGLPNALIEAQGLGVCAVSNRCDHGPDEIIVHGRTGMLVDGHDASQWLAAIRKLLSDNALRRRMGAKARKIARMRFDARRRCRQWQDLLLSVSEQKRRSGKRDSTTTRKAGGLGFRP